MANYEAFFRSNYARYLDEPLFRRLCEHVGATVITRQRGDDMLLGFYCLDGNPGDVIDFDDNETPFVERLAALLADGEVLVTTEAGHEAARYASGCALAINNTGESRSVNLNQIYALARELAPADAKIEVAEY